MRFLDAFASLLSVATLTQYVAADLRITADHFSFGGVNYPGLQTLNASERDQVIEAIVKSGARVIRLFIQQYGDYPDPEPQIGSFDKSLLDMFDDTLAAIHRISEGQVKVIISPHNAHAVRATNDVPCDAYCEKVQGAFLDFYTNEEIRQNYRTRLQVFFKEYPSANFGGRSWGELNEVILGVDVQNEPWSSVHPIVAGETWLCETATHLKANLQLGAHNIAVITGGISGPQSPDGWENFPDSAFDCPAIDVIGIHGYYGQKEEETAGTHWAKMFVPGNTLTARAEEMSKLLLVEEWAYMWNEDLGLTYKQQAIWDQGNALNVRGIPWIYSKLNNGAEGTTSTVSILRGPEAAIGSLSSTLKHASTSRSNFNWSSYLPRPASGLSNLTHIPLNPFIPEQSDCVFGCLGHLCDAADGCAPDLLCKNSICVKPNANQPGKVGDECTSKAPCLAHLKCEDALCQECVARPSIQPKSFPRHETVANDPHAQCHPDTRIEAIFAMRPFCSKPYPQSSPMYKENPCANASHCDANEFCDWGMCKWCTPDMGGCLGAKCKSNNKCKTGYCNTYGRCDYPGLKKKPSGPGASAAKKARAGPGMAPKGAQGVGGANKVRTEALRVNVPGNTVVETGRVKATATATA